MDKIKYKKKRKTDVYYNIGDRIITDTKDITITDVKMIIEKDGDSATKYKYHCNICGFDCNDFYLSGVHVPELWVTKSQINRDKRCSCCASKSVKEGINSIAKTNPELVTYFVDKDNAKRYCHLSNKNLDMQCPYCYSFKNMKISDLYQRGFSCPCCSDGLSIGERIVYIILKNNNIDFVKEYTFQKSKYRYDFYIKNLSMIIEVHGKQHYEETKLSRGMKNLEDEIRNDINKKEFALKNDVKHYICIDCKKSDVDYIIDSIYESNILNILHIQDVNVDFIKQNIYTHSITKDICDLYNLRNDISINEICEKLHFDRTTVRKHLKNGSELGWCDYNPKTYKTSDRVKYINFSRDTFNSSKPIKCNDKYFKGIGLCARLSKDILGISISDSSIRRILNNKTSSAFDFKIEYISQQEFNTAIANNLECYGTPFVLPENYP